MHVHATITITPYLRAIDNHCNFEFASGVLKREPELLLQKPALKSRKLDIDTTGYNITIVVVVHVI